MKIYVADVREIVSEQELWESCKLLSEERREQVQKYRNFDDKRRCVCAGLLLEFGLRQYGFTLCDDVNDKTKAHIATGLYGKPYLLDAEEVHFNLSHSGSYVAGTFADSEVGIDIECSRKANLAVARRFFTKEEVEYLEAVLAKDGKDQQLNEEFVRLWTRKESYIKAVGKGMNLPLNDFCVLSDIVEQKDRYHIKSWELEKGDFLSVCTKEEIRTRPVKIDFLKTI